jgi:hypothetical protein
MGHGANTWRLDVRPNPSDGPFRAKPSTTLQIDEFSRECARDHLVAALHCFSISVRGGAALEHRSATRQVGS